MHVRVCVHVSVCCRHSRGRSGLKTQRIRLHHGRQRHDGRDEDERGAQTRTQREERHETHEALRGNKEMKLRLSEGGEGEHRINRPLRER